MIGSILGGRYRVDSLIGAGGMANVYKAYDEVEKRTVAVKMLKRSIKTTQSSSVALLGKPRRCFPCPILISLRAMTLATMKKPACLTLSWSMWKAAR